MFVKKLLVRLMEEAAEDGRDLPGVTPQSEEESSVNWAEFLSDDEPEVEEELDGEQPPAEEPTPEATPPEEEAPAVQPDQEQPTAPAEEQPVAPPMTAEELTKYRETFQSALEQAYAFSDEDATALQVEPEKVLPKMAARLHMEVLDNVMQHVYKALPDVIKSYTVAESREEKAQNEFFGAWPELRGHTKQVLQMGQMYRQMNPTASPQEAIQRIGEMTMVALGKQRKPTGETVPAPQQAPFKPAAPGRVGTPPPAQGKWDQFLDDDD